MLNAERTECMYVSVYSASASYSRFRQSAAC